MYSSCHRCTRDTISTFLAVVAAPRSTRLSERRRWAGAIRLLTSDAQTVTNDSQPNQAITYQDTETDNVAFLPRRRPVNLSAWRERRANLFGERQGTSADKLAGERQEDSGTWLSKGSAPSSQSTAINGGRKKDRWRNRPGAARQNTQSLRERSTGDNSESETATQEGAVQKPQKDRWRNRTNTDRGYNQTKSARHVSSAEQKQGRRSKHDESQERDVIALPKLLRDFAKPTEQPEPETQLEAWRIQKEAIKKKLGGAAWSPLKKLSPDAMRGVKQLHSEDEVLWSTENLAKHFEISPDAIRRILKSKWEPTEAEREKQGQRWIRRGETIWDRYVELGKKAPRKWRGLEPMPAPKRTANVERVKIKPEEWSRDPVAPAEETVSAQDVDLAQRIM